jgi:hypothetical protein
MRSSSGTVLRWLLAPVAALLGATVAQVVVFQLLNGLFYAATGGYPDGPLTWRMKALTSVFMGAAFVGAAIWAAPRAKQVTALAAFAVVALWGGTLIKSGVTSDFVWLIAMGSAGIAGGALASWLGPRWTRGQSASVAHPDGRPGRDGEVTTTSLFAVTSAG